MYRSAIVTLTQSVYTNQTETTSQNISSSYSNSHTSSILILSTTETTSTAKPDPINWSLIGTIAALMTLLMICCVRCFW